MTKKWNLALFAAIVFTAAALFVPACGGGKSDPPPVAAADYTLSTSQASLSIAQGASGATTITVNPQNGFSSAVALTIGALPAGVTASFNPVSTTGTSTLTLTVDGTAALGASTLTITGTSGSLSHTATLSLTVTAAPDYTLSAAPASLSLAQGGSGTSTITVNKLHGFSGTVDLVASGLPMGVTAAFSPASATATSTLTLTAQTTAAAGDAQVTVTGASGGLSHSVNIAVTVLAPASIRSWTRNGTTFTGTYVKSLGVFNSAVTRHAVIDVASGPQAGKRRAWPISSFSSADQTYIAAMVAAEKPTTADPFLGTYKLRSHSYGYTTTTAGVNTLQTDHFVFWWGSTGWSNDAGRKAYAQWLEDIWSYDRFVLGLGMPYQVVPDNPDNLSDMNRYKINVFVDGTGLPGGQPTTGPGAAAWGSTEICVGLAYTNAGDSVISHEFGHVLQNYAMGFRGWGFGPVGWAWENFAQYHAYQCLPDLPNQIDGWWSDRGWRPDTVTNGYQYAGWAWILHLNEDGGFPSSFPWDLWWNNTRHAASGSAPDTTENTFQTLIRYGGAKGYLDPANPAQAFGDVMGRFAARAATMDYLGQDTLKGARGTAGYTPTEPVPDRSGWYRPAAGQAPSQFGINVIQLVPVAGASTVSVEVNSLADSGDDQDLSSTLVVVDANGVARYSYANTANTPLHGSGTLSMAVSSGETAYLAVAAVPLTAYRPALQHHGFQAFRAFHYEFQATGATPASLPSYATSGTRSASHTTNPDGSASGFIASTATVDATAYVGANAMVLGTAKVQGSARIEGHARVAGSSVVKDHAVVSDYASLDAGTVSGYARVRDQAHLRHAATVTEGAALYGQADIWHVGTIGGKAIIKDGSGVDLSSSGSAGTINGSTLIAKDASFGLPATAIGQGRFYETCKTDSLDDGSASGVPGGNIFTAEATSAENGNYLFANWDFEYPSDHLAMDAWGNSDAILRGTASPTFSTATVKGAISGILTLDGVDQYVLLDSRASDSTDTTIDLMINLADTSTEGQRIFDFGTSAANCFYLTPNEGGKMKLVLVTGGATLEAAAPVPSTNTWINLRVEIDGAAMRLYQDGVQVASAATTAFPMNLGATANYLGRSQAGAGFLKADVDYFRVYRTVVASGTFSTATGHVPGPPPAAQRYYAISH